MLFLLLPYLSATSRRALKPTKLCFNRIFEDIHERASRRATEELFLPVAGRGID